MKITFFDFAEDFQPIPDGVVLEFVEAMAGEGPDGEIGPVATGNKFAVKLNKEQALNHCIQVAIGAGLMTDESKPVVATLADLNKERAKKEKKERKRR